MALSTTRESIPTQQGIKTMHLKEIYLKALRSGGISRAQLKREMHLSFPSISALVDELLGQGILYEVGIRESTNRGRPQTILQLNPNALTIPLAVMSDAGYHYALYDCCANKLAEGFLPFHSSKARKICNDGQWHPSTDELCKPLKSWLASLSQHKLSDLVLSVSGNFDEHGVLTSSATHMVTQENFLACLRESTGNDIVIINSADCYAYAEKFCQELPEDFIYIRVDEGVGAGIIREGKIFQNDVMRAGEIGHISIDYNGRNCICGGKGCLERYISTRVITDEVRQMPDVADSIDFSWVCTAYRQQNAGIMKLIGEKAELLAVGISNMLAMQPVRHVILGGDITMLGDDFLATVQCAVKRRGLHRYMDRVTVTYTKNRSGNAMLGALWNYIDNQMQINTMICQ